TYSGHPVGAAAALACLAETKRLKVNENAALRGTQLFTGLQALQAKYDLVGDVRGGEGLMCCMELVTDREAKTPLDPAIGKQFGKICNDNGVMVRVAGNSIMVSPPLIINQQESNQILVALDVALAAISES
ncbi:MAG: aminotransferase class III-fold pyridoxal phosphate-dependent enzyme, partial [Gammaproteobacteria bacterium]|nr:aminotransferase class III-fold pyridoxal phosphate-dependent enzyme [Gammaproteobacteria bacterium]